MAGFLFIGKQVNATPMRYYYRLLLLLPVLLLFTIRLQAQPRDTLTTGQLLERSGPAYAAQLRPSRYLALDVMHTIGGFRRYRFFEGDEFHFKARGEKYQEEIYAISDTSFSILVANEVMNRDEPISFRFTEIERIYLHRRIPFVTAAGTLFPLAGAVYLVADVVNNRGFYTDALPVPGVLAASGLIFNRLSNQRIKLNKKHRLKVLRTY